MLSTAPVYARGPKAHAAAVQAGIPVWRREPSERLDAMVEHLTARSLAGAHLALQLYGNDVPWAVKALEAAGARVTTVPVYRWVAPDDEGPARRLIRDAIDGQLAAVTFTCPAAARSTCRIADSEGVLDELLEAFESRVAAACVGPDHRGGHPRPRHPGRLLAQRGPPRPARALAGHHPAPEHVHLRTADGEVVLQGSLVATATEQVTPPRPRAPGARRARPPPRRRRGAGHDRAGGVGHGHRRQRPRRGADPAASPPRPRPG